MGEPSQAPGYQPSIVPKLPLSTSPKQIQLPSPRSGYSDKDTIEPYTKSEFIGSPRSSPPEGNKTFAASHVFSAPPGSGVRVSKKSGKVKLEKTRSKSQLNNPVPYMPELQNVISNNNNNNNNNSNKVRDRSRSADTPRFTATIEQPRNKFLREANSEHVITSHQLHDTLDVWAWEVFRIKDATDKKISSKGMFDYFVKKKCLFNDEIQTKTNLLISKIDAYQRLNRNVLIKDRDHLNGLLIANSSLSCLSEYLNKLKEDEKWILNIMGGTEVVGELCNHKKQYVRFKERLKKITEVIKKVRKDNNLEIVKEYEYDDKTPPKDGWSPGGIPMSAVIRTIYDVENKSLNLPSLTIGDRVIDRAGSLDECVEKIRTALDNIHFLWGLVEGQVLTAEAAEKDAQSEPGKSGLAKALRTLSNTIRGPIELEQTGREILQDHYYDWPLRLAKVNSIIKIPPSENPFELTTIIEKPQALKLEAIRKNVALLPNTWTVKLIMDPYSSVTKWELHFQSGKLSFIE